MLKLYAKIIFIWFGKYLSFLLSKKQKVNLDDLEVIFVLEHKLGMGDIIMLYPLINAFSKSHNSKVTIASNWDCFITSNTVSWKHPKLISSNQWKRSLILLPDFNIRSFKYFFKSPYKAGYFFSNSIYSSFSGYGVPYALNDGHYVNRLWHLFNHIGIEAKHYSFEGVNRYPQISDKFNVPSEFICISPFSVWDSRQYSLSRFKKIINELSKKLPVVIIGGFKDKERLSQLDLNDNLNIINLVSQTDIKDLCHVINKSKLFLANDSGPGHLGTIYSKNNIIIFGCCSPETRLPLINDNNYLTSSFSNGSNCQYFPCFNGLTKPNCQNVKKFDCLDIPEELIIRESIKILELRV